MIDRCYSDHNVIVRTKAYGSSRHGLETDTEDAASELVKLSGILYEGIELILRNGNNDNDEQNPKHPTSTTEDRLTIGRGNHDSRRVGSTNDRSPRKKRISESDNIDRLVFAKLSTFNTQGKTCPPNFLRKLFDDQLKKYGYNSYKSDSIISCSQLQVESFVLEMATPQLARAL